MKAASQIVYWQFLQRNRLHRATAKDVHDIKQVEAGETSLKNWAINIPAKVMQ